MRCVNFGASLALGIWCATSVGCSHNAQTPVSNPFLNADRVPPPSTRVLSPGSAQPYYSGEMGAAPPTIVTPPISSPATAYPPSPGYVPGMGGPATGGPATYAPATGMPPATTYPPATTPIPSGMGYPSNPAGSPPPVSGSPYGTAPVNPPGGWGNYPPQGAVAPAMEGDSIAVPADQMAVRFAAADITVGPPAIESSAPTSSPSFEAPRASQYDELAAGGIPAITASMLPPQTALPSQESQASVRTPIQGMLPLRADSYVTPAGYAGNEGAAAGAANAFSSSPTQSAQIRSLSTGGTGWQGEQGGSATNGYFVPPQIGGQSAVAAPGSNATNQQRFGVDAEYRRLRGMLEYDPSYATWRIRYLAPEWQADAFGGAVVVGNPQVLGGLHSGEFIAVEGRLVNGSADPSTLAPLYQIASL
ncbi:MAG: hypothetical protein KDA61_23285, partial [Planctomycetales bacterium]|nr:hypothetical protein [Planctomycetales bacterium]